MVTLDDTANCVVPLFLRKTAMNVETPHSLVGMQGVHSVITAGIYLMDIVWTAALQGTIVMAAETLVESV